MVVKRLWQPVECLYTRYNRLYNRFDNRLCRVNGAYLNSSCMRFALAVSTIEWLESLPRTSLEGLTTLPQTPKLEPRRLANVTLAPRPGLRSPNYGHLRLTTITHQSQMEWNSSKWEVFTLTQPLGHIRTADYTCQQSINLIYCYRTTSTTSTKRLRLQRMRWSNMKMFHLQKKNKS